jgi:hypothetical protein
VRKAGFPDLEVPIAVRHDSDQGMHQLQQRPIPRAEGLPRDPIRRQQRRERVVGGRRLIGANMRCRWRNGPQMGAHRTTTAMLGPFMNPPCGRTLRTQASRTVLLVPAGLCSNPRDQPSPMSRHGVSTRLGPGLARGAADRAEPVRERTSLHVAEARMPAAGTRSGWYQDDVVPRLYAITAGATAHQSSLRRA